MYGLQQTSVHGRQPDRRIRSLSSDRSARIGVMLKLFFFEM